MRVSSSRERQRCGRVPAPAASSSLAASATADGRQQPGHRERERRLAGAVASRDGEQLRGPGGRVDAAPHDDAIPPDGELARLEQHGAGDRAAVHGRARRMTRHPDPLRREFARLGLRAPHRESRPRRSPSGESTTTRSTTGSQVATRCSTTTSVAPVVSSTRATASRTSTTPAGSRFAVGSSSSSRPGRIASTPASARRWRCPPERALVGRSSGDLETDRVEGFAHASPGLLARNPEVLAAERDVVPDAREDDLRVRILQHEPGATAHRAGAERRRSSSVPSCSPSSAPSTPASARSSVDLPEPDAPSSSTRSPGSTRRSSPRVAQARRAACRQPQPDARTDDAVRPAPSPPGPRRTGPARRCGRALRMSSHDRRPGDDRSADDARDRVHGREKRIGARIPEHEVVDRHRETGCRAREHHDRQAPQPVAGTRGRRARPRGPARARSRA